MINRRFDPFAKCSFRGHCRESVVYKSATARTPPATTYKNITIAVFHQEPTFSQMILAHVLARSIRDEAHIWLPLTEVFPESSRSR